MRTTIDLPDDLHQRAKAIARDTERSLSETVAELMRRGLERDDAREVRMSPTTGLPQVTVGRVVTSDDVRAADDDA
ncbi:MAG: antitoxin [Trueperaceae bacterium]|nr:MAG: antitoxin [Trueperaceae bacterium]